ncbi:hypothetical protein AA309_31380 [Microvirga vignae]|uniref:Uncharacterized protein n=1 Tax=Microvirga vignae TaxID=1225564 RepID=A0A0H1R358_9HYPH|nr:hypothetical protein [Microvirga vignae]KLK89449.1 hypothetical protein AA309_31380 [Microvirga vignae]
MDSTALPTPIPFVPIVEDDAERREAFAVERLVRLVEAAAAAAREGGSWHDRGGNKNSDVRPD